MSHCCMCISSLSLPFTSFVHPPSIILRSATLTPYPLSRPSTRDTLPSNCTATIPFRKCRPRDSRRLLPSRASGQSSNMKCARQPDLALARPSAPSCHGLVCASVIHLYRFPLSLIHLLSSFSNFDLLQPCPHDRISDKETPTGRYRTRARTQTRQTAPLSTHPLSHPRAHHTVSE